MMDNNVKLGGFCAILVLGVAIGAVAADDSSLQTSLDSLCSFTFYPDVCIKSLSGAINSSSSPIDVVKAAVDVTVNELTAAAEDVSKRISDKPEVLSYCKGLFEDSLGLLQAVVDEASSIQDLVKKSDDLLHWISAVTSLGGSCSDVLDEDSELKSQIDSALIESWKLVSNGIAIVEATAKSAYRALPADIQHQFDGLGAWANNNSGRKLLSDVDLDNDGYPKWVSAADRRLLAAKRGEARFKPDIVVAKDGSGQFTHISDAVKAVKPNSLTRTVIYVKAGVYDEQVTIPKEKINIYMYGDGGRKSIVTGDKCETKGFHIDTNPTFAIEGTGTILRSMGLRNTAGPEGHQAVALRVKADRVTVVNCHITGYQDTLYVHALRQYYRGCVISGTVDFIFGDAAVVFQKCTILARKGGPGQRNMVTAQGRLEINSKTGIVIHDCKILPHRDLLADRLTVESYLGRPWKAYSRTITMESVIGDLIRPEGYHIWKGDQNLDTLYYAEYSNEGPGADTSRRVRWPGIKTSITRQQAMAYTVGQFLRGDGGEWIRGSGARYTFGLKH